MLEFVKLVIQKVGDILGKYRTRRVSLIYIYFAKGSSHLSQSLIFVQVSHLSQSLIFVQVSHLCKSHICASLTSGQVSHLSKNLIFVQVLLHAHACTFLEHSCVLGYLGPNKDRTRKPVTYFFPFSPWCYLIIRRMRSSWW